MQAAFSIRRSAMRVLAAVGMLGVWQAVGGEVESNAAGPSVQWNQIVASGVLRVGTPGDYAPYAMRVAQGGELLGADIAMARQIALELGLRLELVPTSWTHLVSDGLAGRYDIAVGGISITAERARQLRYSKPYTQDWKQPVVRCGDEKRYDSLGEINRAETRVIVNPGGTNERFARAQFLKAQLTVHANNLSVFDEILAGRADVMVTDAVEARLLQHSRPGLCTVSVGKRWARADKAVLIAGDAALKAAVDRALKRKAMLTRHRQDLTAWTHYPWHAEDSSATRLARLIDERLSIVTEVARNKWNAQAAIDDSPREQALLAGLKSRAQTLGVSPAEVDRFFGAQIEAAKILQREYFEQWRRQQQGQFQGVQDLSTSIRPQIDRVTGQMLETLAEFRRQAVASDLPAASTLRGVSPKAVTTARAPLLSAGT